MASIGRHYQKKKNRNFCHVNSELSMTGHAVQRTAQRNISEEAIHATLLYGTKIHRTGRVFFTLRKKDVADIPELHPFAGTTILMGRDGTIVTAYSNPKSYRVIKKKSKRRSRR